MTLPLPSKEPFRSHDRSILTASGSSEAYTPPFILDAGREALGGVIDLDPCSCVVANEEVKASSFYDQASNGLVLPWGALEAPSRVWCNPPGGFLDRTTLTPSKRGMSSCCAWWYTLLDEYRAGRVRSACFYTFRLDVLQNIQAEEGYAPPHAFPFCIFGERPRHWNKSTPRELRGQQGQPTHACGVFFLPERLRTSGGRSTIRHEPGSVDRFVRAFSPLGYVRV